MIKLSNSINKLINKENFSLIFLGKIENSWKKIVGEKIDSATKIIKIQNRTLFIKCKNPTWKNELQYQKKEILKNINKEFKNIKNIIII